MFWNKKKKVITHNGSYHVDEIFACAVLSILHNGNIKIVRTRDENLFSSADYVVDVGSIYSEEEGRFDHHQSGGAGKRQNGIPYASFGLLWKAFGNTLTNNDTFAYEQIERRLVMPIDAVDNGVDLVESKFVNIFPYRIHEVFYAIFPAEGSDCNVYNNFIKLVYLAERIIRKEIKEARDQSRIKKIIEDAYNKAEDKRILIIEENDMHREPAAFLAGQYAEPCFIIIHSKEGNWKAVCVRESGISFKNRKDFPVEWAGLRNECLSIVSGVPDAIFCHQKLMCITKSKEGAVQMAKNAVE